MEICSTRSDVKIKEREKSVKQPVCEAQSRGTFRLNVQFHVKFTQKSGN